MNAEKPRSSVIPRCMLCGCLSSEAVDSSVLMARAATAGKHLVSRNTQIDVKRRRLPYDSHRDNLSPVLTQARLAAVHVPEDANIDVKHARAGVASGNS